MTTTVKQHRAVKLQREGKTSNHPHMRRPRRRPKWGATAAAVLFCTIWIFPVYWMVNTAFKPANELMTATPLFFPNDPSIDNFVTALTMPSFLQGLLNSVIVVSGTLVLSVGLGLFAAAALSRFRFKGRRTILVFIIAVQMLPGAAVLIPQFIVYSNLGLTGTYTGLILAQAAGALPFSIWVMRGFFIALPVELEEAAALDGAGPWRTMFSVLFPLVTPGIISTSIFAFIGGWNDYLTAYVFMKDSSMYTLPLWLVSFSNPNGNTDYGAQMAASLVFSLPVVIFFLIIHRNLVAGMASGAVKG